MYNYNGVELPEANADEVNLGAVVLFKTMDAHGHIKYREWKSNDLHPIEALGMLETCRDTMKQLCMGNLRHGGPPQ